MAKLDLKRVNFVLKFSPFHKVLNLSDLSRMLTFSAGGKIESTMFIMASIIMFIILAWLLCGKLRNKPNIP